MEKLIEAIFERYGMVRYIAVYQDKKLIVKQRNGDLTGASSSDSDEYEELLVNPTLLTLATQRGEIDCGGLDHLIICYGHFTQIVKQIHRGHISICLEKQADLNSLPHDLFDMVILELKS